jgi:deazaflavin-dependent oxidoreductase (nitroreductase family)
VRYLRPNWLERVLNQLFGLAVRFGLGLGHNYLLEVRGRRTGRIHGTPVNLLEHGGRRYLVSSRGETQWVRNARAASRVVLRKGGTRLHYDVREIDPRDRPPLLKAFLERFAPTVRRYYPVAPGAPVSEFIALAGDYPVFELIPKSSEGHTEIQ